MIKTSLYEGSFLGGLKMVVKELIVGIVTSVISLVSKYLKELLIFALGVFVGTTFFPKVEKVYQPSEKVIEKVEVIKEVPVQTSSGASLEFVKKNGKDDVDIEIESKGVTVKGLYTKTDGSKIYFDFPTKENEIASKEDGKFIFRQEAVTSIDVTEIVDKLNAEERERHQQEMEKQKSVEKRRVVQHAFWGAVGGFLFGKVKD